MKRRCRTLLPLPLIGLAVLAVIDAVTTFQTERMGRGAFNVVSVPVWLFLAYMLYETTKRIPTDEKSFALV